MKRFRLICSAVVSALILLVQITPLQAASMGNSGDYDLDKIWSRAQQQFDLSDHDAILLVESMHISILANGDKHTKVHRIVWVGAASVMRSHADLRIPYNSSNSTLTVAKLRTWRDDTWWPRDNKISPTAVVETLPFALARADDYTAMRETMLLHDGVEIPCIMETAYVIEERGNAGDGADGLWIFPQNDPAVLTEFALSTPSAAPLTYRAENGAPKPEETSEGGQTTYRWKMENVDPLGSPHLSDPARYAPYVLWSTWPDWNTIGQKILSIFDETAVLNDALSDTLTSRLKHEPSEAAKAHAIAALVNEWTRSIHYDSHYWSFSPRPATRTWETAYGHGLDRAVLATALFQNVGLDAEPVFRSNLSHDIIGDIPSISCFESFGVLVERDRFQAFFDPVEGTLTEGLRPLHDRVLWKPASGKYPSAYSNIKHTGDISRYELILTLEPDEENGWVGTGFLSAGGFFSPYGDMVGLSGEALATIRKIASSVLPGATVSGFNPEVFDQNLITVGFDLKVDAPEPDDLERTRFAIGNPAGGIVNRLPSDVSLYHEHRNSPVFLQARTRQGITLRLKTGKSEIIYLPESKKLENDVGRFTLNAVKEDGWVTLKRELIINASTTAPEAWPDLRALLLEETDPAGRTILMK